MGNCNVINVISYGKNYNKRTSKNRKNIVVIENQWKSRYAITIYCH